MAISNDDLLQDLKQFINTKIDGVESRLDSKIDGVETRLNTKIDGIECRLDDIDAKIDTVIEDIGGDVVKLQGNLNDHSKRLKKLESKLA